MSRGISFVVGAALFATPALAGKAEQKLLERIMAYATQPDVVLVPPAGELTPPLGSFVVPYVAPNGAMPDPAKAGTFEAAPSSCSDALRFNAVASSESRQEIWATETGIGMSIGLPVAEIGGSFGRKSIAGIEYHLSQKMVIDRSSLADLEECCLRTPERCTNHYISEAWQGTGRIHRMTATKASLSPAVRQLQGSGSVQFGHESGWSMASEWSEPQYFAYRTVAFQTPSCESYMNDLPEKEGQLRFAGVSSRVDSEQEARRDARDDARRQVVEYLGQQYSIQGDSAIAVAEAVLSGVKDSLTCMDPIIESASGPRYLARVRMYVSMDEVDAGRSTIESQTGTPRGAPEPEPAPTPTRRPTPRPR